MKITIGAMLHLSDVGALVRRTVKEDLTRENPEYAQAFKSSRSTHGIPETVMLYSEDGAELVVPRHYNGFPMPLEGEPEFESTCTLNDVHMPATFFSAREPVQEDAVVAMVNHLRAHRGGILCAGTGKGKTVMGTEIALRLGQKTLVLVHKDFLADQFAKTWAMLTKLPEEEVGLVKGPVCRVGEHITVALVQTLLSRSFPPEWYEQFGLVIADEIHRHGAAEWGKTISLFPGMYRLGLTATLERKDKMHEVVMMHFGPPVFTIEGTDVEPTVYQRELPTKLPLQRYTSWLCENCGSRFMWANDEPACRCGNVKPGIDQGKLLSILASLPDRNAWLSKQIGAALSKDRQVMVISDRVTQLDLFAGQFPGSAGRFYGSATSKKRQAELDRALTMPLLLTTYMKGREGLDVPRLDTLIFATPRADVTQAVGRILRAGNKRALVIDPVDAQVPILRAYSFARSKSYQKAGWTVSRK